jgi:dCTP deaminase
MEQGDIKITPEPKDSQIQPASIDLQLGEEFLEIDDYNLFIDPHCNVLMKEIKNSYPYSLAAKGFALGTTIEKIELPDYIVGRVEGRSSLGRLGLMVHSTAGYIDPGFSGQITLEFVNNTDKIITLFPYMKICQIVFETISSPALRPYGHKDLNSKYHNQEGVQGSLIHLDKP